MTNEEELNEWFRRWNDEGDGRFFLSDDDFDTIISALKKQIPKKPIKLVLKASDDGEILKQAEYCKTCEHAIKQ